MNEKARYWAGLWGVYAGYGLQRHILAGQRRANPGGDL